MSSHPAYDPSAFPPFAVTADLVILTVNEGELKILLVERRSEPFKGRLALPGGFINAAHGDRSLADTPRRELAEETGLHSDAMHLEQLKTYWTLGRDPRMEVVTVAWLALAPITDAIRAGSDAAAAAWVPVEEALHLALAFDHDEILRDGLERARSKLEYTDIAATFLGPTFTIAEVRHIYETVWGTELDPGNFQRKMTNVFDRVDDAPSRSGGPGRPAALFRRRPPLNPREGHGLALIDPPFRRIDSPTEARRP